MVKVYSFVAFAILFCACQNTPPNGTQTAVASDATALQARSAAKATIAWHCAGTEPFWIVEISPTDNTAVVMSPEKTHDPIQLTVINETPDAATYTGENLKISIQKGKCSDGMSEDDYTHTAEVVYDIYQFKGCANRK